MDRSSDDRRWGKRDHAISSRWVSFPLYFVSFAAVLTFSTFFRAAGSGRSSGMSFVTSLVIGVTGGLLMTVLLMALRPLFLAKRRRQEQEMFAISRPEEWAILNRAAQKGDPPADTSFDRQLLALVTYRHGRLRRAWALVWLYGLVLIISILGVVLSPTRGNIVQLALFTSVGLLLLATCAYSSRRMARLEEELRNRLPQPMEPQRGRSPSSQPHEGRPQEEPPQAE
jgi:Flp pilus assembly protein TadB